MFHVKQIYRGLCSVSRETIFASKLKGCNNGNSQGCFQINLANKLSLALPNVDGLRLQCAQRWRNRFNKLQQKHASV